VPLIVGVLDLAPLQRFVDTYRHAVRLFTQTRYLGPGVLRVRRPDGGTREIDAYYQSGLEGEPGQGHVSARVVVSLYCPDGFWRDSAERIETRSHQAGGPYLRPYITVSSGRVLGDTDIVNPGEVDGWPVWTITGPATSVTATHRDLGEAFTLTYTLLAGQPIIIVTGGDRPTLRGPNGENLNGFLDWPGAELWPLKPGLNRVSFQVNGAATGTSIVLAYHPRYEMS
jgi:hypothetical protein